MTAVILRGDARALPLPDVSVDAIVCDPPYGLEFMGKEWDSFRPSSARLRTRVDGRTNPAEGKSTVTTPEAYVAGAPFQAWCREWAAEALRVLKPGGYLLAFGGTRTAHRLVCGVEDAGFEIRDSITWLYGSGFPKSLDVSKAIDAAAGVEREIVGPRVRVDGKSPGRDGGMRLGRDDELGALPTVVTAPATDDAARWAGWGTALKPASEPIVVARKPFAGTVAANVLAFGTGALNIDACRVPVTATDAAAMERANTPGSGRFKAGRDESAGHGMGRSTPGEPLDTSQGRWPSNVLLDEHTAADLDAQAGIRTSGKIEPHHRQNTPRMRGAAGTYNRWVVPVEGGNTGASYGDSGGASRFFPTFRYQAKAPTDERPVVGGVAHPTVKPVDLMRWLVRLVTQPGGIILDPFAGSGTTVEAAMLEGFDVIGVERDPQYLPLIQHRIDRANRRQQPGITRLGVPKPPAQLAGQGDLFDALENIA